MSWPHHDPQPTAKFQTPKMSAGSVEDFFEGLTGRFPASHRLGALDPSPPPPPGGTPPVTRITGSDSDHRE